MKPEILAAAAWCAISTSALAAEPTAPHAPPTPPAQAQAQAEKPRDGELSADMATQLRKAGFTDLQILPNSVFVRAKDKDGHAVAMILNPGSMTEVVTLDPHAGSASAGNGAALTGSGTFATVLPTEKLASGLIGAPVVDKAGDKVGTVKDLAIDHGGVHAYIIAVGGLFGIGDRYLAVTPGALKLAYDTEAQTYRASVEATLDQLKAAPEFRYKDATKRD